MEGLGALAARRAAEGAAVGGARAHEELGAGTGGGGPARAAVQGERRCTATSRGHGRAQVQGEGGGGVGMEYLQGTVAIEIADRGWKIYRVLNILLWRVKFRGHHYR